MDSEGCEDATKFFKRVAAERELAQKKLEAIHKKQLDKFPKEHPPSVFVAGDQVWVQNRDETEKSSVEYGRDPLRSLTRSLTPFTGLTTIDWSRSYRSNG